MAYADLRDWLKAVESRGELLRLSGVSHELEMGGIMEILDRQGKRPIPAVLYEDVPGYQKGYRALFGQLASTRRIAMALGLPEDQLGKVDLVRNWRNKRRTMKLIPPQTVETGPVIENVLTGKDIDLLKIPVPRYHELDGGRYFGTANVLLTRDADTGWINLGTYRSMLVDRNHLAIHISPGGQGLIMMEQCLAKKQPFPIAIALGVDPALWFAGFNKIPWGTSEYDFAGGIRGEAIKVIKAPYTGMPIPANAEIVVEGDVVPGEYVDEGPFGEWHGYYANQGLEKVREPLMTVKTLMHRNDPIYTGVQVGNQRTEYRLAVCVAQSGAVWDALESCAVPGVQGVWCHESGGGSLLNIVSLKTAYAGHSRQAGIIASEIVQVAGHYTIVVDEDIDPSNLDDVMWAVATRVDPQRAIDITHYCRTSNVDPAVPIAEKRKTPHHFTSHAIIDACRGYEWKHEYYPIAQISPSLRDKLLKKWGAKIKAQLA